jgi:hypothetical protein
MGTSMAWVILELSDTARATCRATTRRSQQNIDARQRVRAQKKRPQRRGVRPNGISDNSPAGNADGGLDVM